MPLDASIFNAVQGPADFQAQTLKLNALSDQNALTKLQLSQAQQADTDRMSIRDLARTYGGDQGAFADALTRGGFIDKANTVRTSIANQRKAMTEAEKAQVEMFGKRLEVQGRVLGAVKDQGSYQQALPLLASAGIDVSKFPPTYDPAFVQQATSRALTTAEQLTQQWKQKEFALSENNSVIGADGAVNQPFVSAKQTISKAGAPNIQVNNVPLGKTGENKVDEGLLNTTSQLMGLKRTQAQFKPEFLQLGTRIGSAWSALKEKGGVDLPLSEKRALGEFASFRRNSIDAMNKYIQSVTGAAMSEPEAIRIMQGLPNPGMGMFDGDSPTEYKSKMDDAMRQVNMAQARYVYIRQHGGMSIDQIPLSQMPQVMNERAREIEQETKKNHPNMNEKEIREFVKQQTAQEFGLVE